MTTATKATYSHVGYRPHTGYRHRGRDANHYSAVAGKRHALNAHGDHYVALCGELIRGRYSDEDDYCNELGLGEFVTVEPAADTCGTGVSCARCRKILGIQRWAVQALCPYSGRWYAVKDHDQYATKQEAEAALAERNQLNPRQSRRVRLV